MQNCSFVYFCFRFIWQRTNTTIASSEVEIIWNIEDKVEPGTYRISHFGDFKYILGGIHPYEGVTNEFEVTKKNLKSKTNPLPRHNLL